MPVLSNIKHERFAQELAKGLTQVQAYEAAGYKPDIGAACRLSKNVKVMARVNEIKERGAIRAEITVATLLLEIEEARVAALSAETVQASAAVSASMAKAKLAGLLVDKQEVSGPNGGPVEVKRVELVAVKPKAADD
jgi:phage terminase small subunit